MNRRAFMRIIAGAAAIPLIGLPRPTEAAYRPINLIQEWIDDHPEVWENRGDGWYYYYCVYDDPVIAAELDAKMKRAMDGMVFKPPLTSPQTLTVSIKPPARPTSPRTGPHKRNCQARLTRLALTGYGST